MTVKWGSTSQILNDQFYGAFNVDGGNLTGLTFAWTAGRIVSGTSTVIAAGTLAMADDTTNFVYIEAGSVATATSIPATDVRLLFQVVTASGVITAITDLRSTLSIGN